MQLPEARFDTGEVDINYAEGPDAGPPFVILHGGSGRWQYSEELIEALVPSWHVFAPDFRGHGRSGHVRGAYFLTDYVRDIASFLANVVVEPAVIYGHSLGGEVAVMLGARYPDLPRAIIVGDAPLSRHNQATQTPGHRAQNELWHRLAGRPEPEIEAALRTMHLSEIKDENSPWFAHQATSLHQLDPDMLAAVLAGPEIMLDGYEPELVLPAITCPVLLLQADPALSGVLPDAEVALAMRLVPTISHIQLKGIGHPLHGPPGGTRIVLEACRPFLAALRPGQSYAAPARQHP